MTKIYNLCSIEDFTKNIINKIKLLKSKQFLKENEKIEINHGPIIKDDEYRFKYQKILSELKSVIEKEQIEIIIKYKNENILTEIEKFRLENENLIKTFKIPERITRKLVELANIKLKEDVEYMIRKEKNENNLRLQSVQQDKYFTYEIDNSHLLKICHTIINLLKKYKNRIHNFTIQHIMPLGLLLEEKFTDFQNSLKNEFDYFKKFELTHLKEYSNRQQTYSLKRFNYDKVSLRNSEIRKKSDMFKIFFEFSYSCVIENCLKTMELEIRKNTIDNPIYKKLKLLFEQFNEMKLFFSTEFEQTKEKFKENWNHLQFILKKLSEKIKHREKKDVEQSLKSHQQYQQLIDGYRQKQEQLSEKSHV